MPPAPSDGVDTGPGAESGQTATLEVQQGAIVEAQSILSAFYGTREAPLMALPVADAILFFGQTSCLSGCVLVAVLGLEAFWRLNSEERLWWRMFVAASEFRGDVRAGEPKTSRPFPLHDSEFDDYRRMVTICVGIHHQLGDVRRIAELSVLGGASHKLAHIDWGARGRKVHQSVAGVPELTPLVAADRTADLVNSLFRLVDLANGRVTTGEPMFEVESVPETPALQCLLGDYSALRRTPVWDVVMKTCAQRGVSVHQAAATGGPVRRQREDKWGC